MWDHVTCSSNCPSNDVGEINVNLRGLLATERGNLTPFSRCTRTMAPAIYLDGNPEPPGAAVARTFEQDLARVDRQPTPTRTAQTEPLTEPDDRSGGG